LSIEKAREKWNRNSSSPIERIDPHALPSHLDSEEVLYAQK